MKATRVVRDAEPGAAPARTLPPPARVAMVRALAEGMADSFAAADLEAVRLALDAIGGLAGRRPCTFCPVRRG